MHPYDDQKEHLQWYFSQYPYVIIINGHLDYEWINENLDKTYPSQNQNCMGRNYTVDIVGYGMCPVTARPDEIFYFFYDYDHVLKIKEAFPEQIVTDDPFGPEAIDEALEILKLIANGCSDPKNLATNFLIKKGII